MAAASRAWVGLRQDPEHVFSQFVDRGPLWVLAAVRPSDLVATAVLLVLLYLAGRRLLPLTVTWERPQVRAASFLAFTACVVLAFAAPGWAGRGAAMLIIPMFCQAMSSLLTDTGPDTGIGIGEGRGAVWDAHAVSACTDPNHLHVHDLEGRSNRAVRAAADGDPRPLQDLLDQLEPRLAGSVAARSWPMQFQADVLVAKGRYGEAADILDEVLTLAGRDDNLEAVRAKMRLTDALAGGRTPPPAEVTEYARALPVPSATVQLQRPAPYLHGLSMLRLAQGRPAEAAELAGRSRGQIADPRDRAVVDATLVIALARSGDLDGARKWLKKVPPECPLYPAASHEVRPAGRSTPPATAPEC